MELLREVRLDRVEQERRRRDADEAEHVLRHDQLRLAEHRLTEGDVDAEGLAVALAGQLALGAKAKTLAGLQRA